MGNCCSETPSSLLKRHVNHLRRQGLTTTDILNDEDTRMLISEFRLYDVLPTDLQVPDKLAEIRLESRLRKRPPTLQEILNQHNYINYA